MRRSLTRTRAAATERCVCRTGSGKIPTHASALGNAPSFSVPSTGAGGSTSATIAFFFFSGLVGWDGSCAAMLRSTSSVFGYLPNASDVRSASISRTAISPAGPPSTSPCVPRFPRVSAPSSPFIAAFPTSASVARSGSSPGSSGSHRMNDAYCSSCFGYPRRRSGKDSTGLRPNLRSAAAFCSAQRSAGSIPITSSYSSSGLSPTSGAKPYEMSSSEDGRVP
mmetsp:Transcript_19648/g.31821  ORF Transcript_19648/g.31821 Transcript_19648/m.31821 type:complete len:223 (+) Transcript_19648:1119-1787(+)